MTGSSGISPQPIRRSLPIAPLSESVASSSAVSLTWVLLFGDGVITLSIRIQRPWVFVFINEWITTNFLRTGNLRQSASPKTKWTRIAYSGSRANFKPLFPLGKEMMAAEISPLPFEKPFHERNDLFDYPIEKCGRFRILSGGTNKYKFQNTKYNHEWPFYEKPNHFGWRSNVYWRARAYRKFWTMPWCEWLRIVRRVVDARTGAPHTSFIIVVGRMRSAHPRRISHSSRFLNLAATITDWTFFLHLVFGAVAN